jgi:nicotinamidase-related amidase
MTDRFTSDSAVLLLIDFQVGTSQLIKTQDPALTIRNGVALAKTALVLGVPIVLTTSVEEQQQGAVSPELRDAIPEAYAARIKRTGVVNAWDDPDFRTAVGATGRRQLIMAGVTTDICLVYPAISAVREGYEVQAVIDASGSPFEVSEEMARRRMQHEGVVLTATNTVIAELAHDWSTPTSQQLTPILFGLLPTIHATKSFLRELTG